MKKGKVVVMIMRFCCTAALAVILMPLSGSAADESMDLVADGKGLPIVLPTVTELDDFLSTTPEATRAAEARRFPKATAEELDRIVRRRIQWRQEEKARVGDEEKLAAQELADYLSKNRNEFTNVAIKVRNRNTLKHLASLVKVKEEAPKESEHAEGGEKADA